MKKPSNFDDRFLQDDAIPLSMFICCANSSLTNFHAPITFWQTQSGQMQFLIALENILFSCAANTIKTTMFHETFAPSVLITQFIFSDVGYWYHCDCIFRRNFKASVKNVFLLLCFLRFERNEFAEFWRIAFILQEQFLKLTSSFWQHVRRTLPIFSRHHR